MRFARMVLIFGIGFYAVSCQALLFRQFLVSFEGNELGIGVFFSSWLIWIGIGALTAVRGGRITEQLVKHFEFFTLLYLPAFIVQHLLIGQARSIMGIDPYQLFSFGSMAAASFLVNAPVSLLTGILFPLGCQWLEKSSPQPVARVYLIESAGSFMGGLTVTILLFQGALWTTVFLINALILAGAVTFTRVMQKRFWPAAALLVFIAVILITGGSEGYKDYADNEKWRNLLPAGEFKGSFQTAQAEYLWGKYQGQFVVASQGRVCESLPEAQGAAEIIALHLCQNPAAQRVLLAGSNILGTAQRLLQLSQIEEITLFHTDRQYLTMIRNLLPEFEAFDDRRLTVADVDLRTLLRQRSKPYDIVILNFPDAASAVLNRYSTVELYQQIKTALAEEGLVGVRIAGGENVIGRELADLGASAISTLNTVFDQVVIKPGEQTWLLASDSDNLTEDAVELHRRFSSIAEAEKIYPATGILSLYPANRILATRQAYEQSHLPQELLINRDRRPLGHLYNLLLLGRHARSPLTGLIKKISLAGMSFFLLPIGILLVLRGVYGWRSRRYQTSGPSHFEIIFLIFSTGMVSIGTEIILMYLYQTCYGSLYLYVGLIASLFMLGLALGAGLGRWLLKVISWRTLAFTTVLFHTALLTGAYGLGSYWSYPLFGGGFILCGILTGIYFPPAARALETAGLKARRAAGVLDGADHFGAAAGALTTGIIILAALGADRAFLVMAALTGVNIFFLALQPYTRTLKATRQRPALFIRKAGYICFGIGVAIIAGSNLLARAGEAMTATLTPEQAALAAPETTLELNPKIATLAQGSRKLSYFEIIDKQQQAIEYIFDTRLLAGKIRGYAGPIHLVVRIDNKGHLLDYRILSSYETPSYLELLEDWPNSLLGRNLFEEDALQDAAAVTGATITCQAIAAILEQSGRRFAEEALGLPLTADLSAERIITARTIDLESIYLLTGMVLAVVISRWGGRWIRRILLLVVLVMGGWYFNLQYSSEQMVTLLSGRYPNVGLTHNFLMVIGIPVLVILWGNLYCGYLCPFGALQEFADYLILRRWKVRVPGELMQTPRFGKYLVLLFLLGFFFLSGDLGVLKPDILITFFGGVWHDYFWCVLPGVLAGTLLFTRFWCRYLCPAGAFLALLARWSPLKRLLPAKNYHQCDLGVAGASELDCICCDRCRYESASEAAPEWRPSTVRAFSRLLLAMTFLGVLWTAGASSRAFWQKIAPLSEIMPPGRANPAAGEPRNVDIDHIRRLIQQGRLSDQEALYYEKIK